MVVDVVPVEAGVTGGVGGSTVADCLGYAVSLPNLLGTHCVRSDLVLGCAAAGTHCELEVRACVIGCLAWVRMTASKRALVVSCDLCG